MHPKLKLIFLAHSGHRGFALPFTLGVGLVMLLAGTVMIVRSQSDQSQTKAQQSTAEGVSAAEVGATRIAQLMNKNRYIAIYPDCIDRTESTGACNDSGTATFSWANVSNLPKLTVCNSENAGAIEDVSIDRAWTVIDSNNSAQGEYRLIGYQYSTPGTAPGTGKLTVEGRTKQLNDLQMGATKLEVQIPVSPGTPDQNNVPGVWLVEGGTGNNEIQGDVLLGDCDADPATINVTGTDPDTGEAYKAQHTNLQFPELPEIPASASNLGVLGEDLGVTAANLSGDITLPRDSDSSTPQTIKGQEVAVYHYVVDAINFSSGHHKLTIKPGYRVNIYLQGSIDVKGNTEIVHVCTDDAGNAIANCQPTDFKIFGYGDSSSTICTAGNKRVEAFILAPEYTVGTAGTGGGKGGLKGSVWANEWSNGKSCGSNTSNTAVVQTGRWDELGLTPKNTPPQLSAASTWQRQER